ncbi:MAG: hypothetical protein E7439_06830, partial [Ruminococcaceae bacterium]|nr:hypothetical protein [Oscillospiraceae bacterium]
MWIFDLEQWKSPCIVWKYMVYSVLVDRYLSRRTQNMKKLTSMLVALAVMLIAAVLFLPTEARAATEGYYTYTVSNGEATITSCSDTQGGDIEIPSTLGGYPVTSIGDGAFSDMGIGAVEIPDGVTSIGGGAFAENHNLLIVNIPDSVTSIGDFAFSGCNRLPEIIIPDSVTSIGDGAFSGCNQLLEIIIPDGVTSIGDSVFASCTSLTSVTILDSVTSIGKWAFYGCASLTSVTYCGTEEQWNAIIIGTSNSYLTNATRQYHNYQNRICTICGAKEPKKIIASGTCGTNLTWTLDDEGTLTISGTGAMWDFIDDGDFDSSKMPWYNRRGTIKSVVIENGVKGIGYCGFWGCSGLTSVVIPDSVTWIDEYAFAFCDNLTSVTYCGTKEQWNAMSIGAHNRQLTNAVRQYHDYAGASCAEQKTCTVCGTISAPGHIWREATCTEAQMCISCGAEGDAALGHEYIGYNNACTRCKLNVTASGQCGANAYWVVDSTGTYYIYGSGEMWNFESYDDERPFYYANRIVILNGVTSIGRYAFVQMNIDITIPTSVTKIGYHAFHWCEDMTEFTYCGTEEQWNAIDIADYNAPLVNARRIPEHMWSGSSDCSESGVCYTCGLTKEASNHDYLASSDACGNCGLNAVDYGWCGTNVKWLLDNAGTLYIYGSGEMYDYNDWSHYTPWGSYCSNINTVVVSAGITYIGTEAYDSYWGDYSFTSAIYCGTNLSIARGNSAFTEVLQYHDYRNESCVYCGKSSVVASGKCGANLSWKFDELGTLTISGTGDMYDYESWGAPWYDHYANIKSVIVKEGVTSIGEYAFDSCEKITSILIPGSVTKIGYGAFSYCTSLTKVTYCGTSAQWAAITIEGDNNAVTKATRSYHSYTTATCANAKICIYCGHTTGDLASHKWGSGTVITEATYTSTGLKFYTCTVCGGTKTEVIPQIAWTAGVINPRSVTLSLDDLIFLNVYSDYTNGTLSREYIETHGGLLYWNAANFPADGVVSILDTNAIVVPGLTYNTGNGRYLGTTEGIALKNLGDTLKICSYVELPDGTIMYSRVIEYSGKKYAMSRINAVDSLTNPTAKDLAEQEVCIAMLNAVYEAQKFFKHNLDTPANAELSADRQVVNYNADMITPA